MQATADYLVKGSTGDITTCDHCGRTNLRKTVILATLDADGAEEDIVHFGVDCAARASGRTQTAIRNAAAAVDTTREQARQWAARTLPAMQRLSVADYIAANSFFAGRPTEQAAAALAATITECRQILAGNLAGTRFDATQAR